MELVLRGLKKMIPTAEHIYQVLAYNAQTDTMSEYRVNVYQLTLFAAHMMLWGVAHLAILLMFFNKLNVSLLKSPISTVKNQLMEKIVNNAIMGTIQIMAHVSQLVLYVKLIIKAMVIA